MDSIATQSEDSNDFVDQLQSYETKNRRILTAREILNFELERKEFVMNYFVYHQQTNSVANNETLFLQLKHLAETRNEEKFDEKWIVSIFVKGLKEDIKDCAKICCLDSLQRAIVLAKWRELCLEEKVFDKSPEPTKAKANSEIGKEFVYHEETEQEPSMKVNSIDPFTLISSYHVSMFAPFLSSSLIYDCGCQTFDEMPKWDKNPWKSKLRDCGLYWGERGKFKINDFSFSQFLTLDLLDYAYWAVIVDYEFFYLAVGKVFTEKVYTAYMAGKSYNETEFIMDLHHVFLSKTLGSNGAELQSILYSYANGFLGFAVVLSQSQVELISGFPRLICVVLNNFLSMHMIGVWNFLGVEAQLLNRNLLMGLSGIRYNVGVLDIELLLNFKSYTDESLEKSALRENGIKLYGCVLHDFVNLYAAFLGSIRVFLADVILQLSSNMKERGRILLKFADLVEENAEELAALDTIDAGKLFHWCKTKDIPEAAETIRYSAGAADKIHGETLKMSKELQALHITHYTSPLAAADSSALGISQLKCLSRR